jgi:hypothetical protein
MKRMENSVENRGMYLVHHCKGYIENVEHLPLSKETSERAKHCGFNVVDFAEACLKTITHNVSGNGYDDMGKIVDSFADVVILFLKKYRIKDIEIARFQSNDTQEEITIYLSESHGGYLIVRDENGEPSVRVTRGDEIWRYLGEPLHIIETIISAIVAYAEKHKSVKDKWLFTLEDIGEISGEQKYEL